MDKKEHILKRIISNIYVKNVLMMLAILVVLIAITLFILSIYTRHNESVVVPQVTGLEVGKAGSILSSSDLKYEVIDSIFRVGGVPGAIIDQVPKENAKVKTGRTIYLIIQAKSQQMVEIPELRDFSQRQAEAQLNSLGFNKIVINYTPTAYSGLVVSVAYKGKAITPGQKIPKGSTLTMTVGGGGETLEGDSLEVPATTTSTDADKSFF
ncbi:MAG: PASTA domain-containing protein [Dysgonomonas sp.]